MHSPTAPMCTLNALSKRSANCLVVMCARCLCMAARVQMCWLSLRCCSQPSRLSAPTGHTSTSTKPVRPRKYSAPSCSISPAQMPSSHPIKCVQRPVLVATRIMLNQAWSRSPSPLNLARSIAPKKCEQSVMSPMSWVWWCIWMLRASVTPRQRWVAVARRCGHSLLTRVSTCCRSVAQKRALCLARPWCGSTRNTLPERSICVKMSRNCTPRCVSFLLNIRRSWSTICSSSSEPRPMRQPSRCLKQPNTTCRSGSRLPQRSTACFRPSLTQSRPACRSGHFSGIGIKMPTRCAG